MNAIKTTTKELNIGWNKGRPRLWLEGAVLAEAGFNRGDHYKVRIDRNLLELKIDPEGKRKVSGKADKPIIDMTGKTLEAAGFSGDMRVKITGSPGKGWLSISKAHQ